MKSSSPFPTVNDESERFQVTGELTTIFAENVFPGWSSGQVASNDCEESIENGSFRVSTLPTGAGIMWGLRDILEDMPAYMGGGEMIADVFLDHSIYTELPHKFEAGIPAIGEFVGFGAAIEYLEAIGMDDIHRFEEEIGSCLYESLTAFKEVTVYGPPPPRAALCAFNVEGVHSCDLATMLALEGVAVRSGHHCAQPLHRELGVSSSARATMYIYNKKEEVDKFMEAMKGAVELLGSTLTPESSE